jgi:hypothetical protein
MATYLRAIEEIQWAREAVAGTDLATTSKILVTEFNVTPDSILYKPQPIRGLWQRNRGFETVVARGTQWSMAGPLTYEQAPNWLNYAVANVASPTGLSPYTWVHTRNPAAVPSLATFTLERKENDGATPIGHAWHYCVLTKLTISWAENEPLMFAAEGFARRVQTETLTAGQSLPTAEIPPTQLAALSIDTSYANLGVTPITSQILSGSIEINTGAYPIKTLDARSDLDFNTIGFNADEASVNLKVNALLGAQYATEKTAAEAGTLRAIQVLVTGTSSRSFKIGGLFKYAVPELFEFGDLDGSKVIGLDLEETTDGTNLLTATVVNTISALV